jgi:hypothetical protein
MEEKNMLKRITILAAALAIVGILVLVLAVPALAQSTDNENASCISREITKINAHQDESQPDQHGYLGQQYINADERRDLEPAPGVGWFFGNNEYRYCQDYYP